MASTLRIAFVANTSWSIYKFRLYLIRQLVEKGFDIYILAPRDPYTTRFEHLPGLTYVELHHFRARSISPLQDLLLYTTLLRHYRTLQPDLIFQYTIKANIFGTLAAARARIPAVSVITGLGYAFAGRSWLRTAARILYRRALRKNKEVWFLNEDDREVFIKGRLVDPRKTFILPGEGVDTTTFFAAPYQPGKETVTFLLIGRIIVHKGIREFAAAATTLLQKGLPVRCQLLGVFDDDNPVAIPRHEVEEWEHRGILTYLGYTDDVPPVIEQADCIVLPSYREGIPLSLLEGASMAKALIATDTPGCRTLIEEGVNGFLCRPADGNDLAQKMAAYFHLSPAAKRYMGLAGREKIVNYFTRQRITGIYLEKIDALGAKDPALRTT